MTNGTPKSIIEAVSALRTERLPLAARLDAIDLAIENICRVYGINGAPQPLPFQRAAKGKAKGAAVSADAAERRQTLLTVIGKSDIGLTLAELRKVTPKMDGKDRSNALQVLKSEGKIKRAGNAWKAA